MLNKIKFSYREANDQSHNFTSYHTKFKCKIKYCGLQYAFTYQCNTDYDEPNLVACLYAITSDMFCYDNSRNFTDFCDELGYANFEKACDKVGYNFVEAKKAYKACKKTSKALHRLFTDDELDDIMAELTEEGY